MMIKGVIFDLDGTVYRGDAEVPGAAGFIAWLKNEGIKHIFVTNRANRTPAEIARQLHNYGIESAEDQIITTAQVTASYLKKGKVFFIGEDGLRHELEKEGFVITDKSPDYVVVSFDREPTRDKIEKAGRLIKAGAKFIATNPDKGLPTETGFRPGTGAIVEAVTKETGVEPLVIGKPEKLIIELALKYLGLARGEVLSVGDNVETDLPAGASAGVRTVLILTGISRKEDIARYSTQPDWIVENYKQLTEIIRRENAMTEVGSRRIK